MAQQPHVPDAPPDTPEPQPEFLRWFKENSIPIGGLVLIGLVLCVAGHYSTRSVDWNRTKDFTDVFRNVTQGLAFIAGGLWAYYKFVKGRNFQDSLSPAITGRFVSIDGATYLVIAIQLKNAGSTSVEFDCEGSAIIIYEYKATSSADVHSVAAKHLTTFQLFDSKERSMEPNEILELKRFIGIPEAVKLGYRLEVEILSKSGLMWFATAIVDNVVR